MQLEFGIGLEQRGPPNKAGAGLGGDIGQFSMGFELCYSKSSTGDPAVSARLKKRANINRVHLLEGGTDYLVSGSVVSKFWGKDRGPLVRLELG